MSLPVLGVGFGVGLVTVGLARLRQQDQRGRVGRLQTERKVQKNEWIDIEVRNSGDIDENQIVLTSSLNNEEHGRSKKNGQTPLPSGQTNPLHTASPGADGGHGI